VDECQSCRVYVKTVDLRKDGTATAVPEVEDFASVELDLWSGERGLEKVRRNLLGF
jgi:formate dehydrogenase maturation protein FdhE